MISRLFLKAGASSEAAPLDFDPGPITVIVGPNYSGKSKLIREIQWYLQHGRSSPNNVILSHLKTKPIDPKSINDIIDAVIQKPNFGETLRPDHIIIGRLGSRQQVSKHDFIEAVLNFSTAEESHYYRNRAASWFFSQNTIPLDGQSRITLTNDQPFGDLNSSPTNTLQKLFRDDSIREEIRRIVADAFGLYLVVDPTNAGQLRLRLSKRPPEDLNEEQSLTQRSAKFHSEATMLTQSSDGTRAFCGILTEIMVGKPDLLLLDEPEAFLHPSLSYKLGREMARQVQGQKKNIIVLTHSPTFLMGCVSSGVPVNVVRLTYKKGVATARLLPADQLSSLMKNPLLRSAGVLSSLFYESIVITEGDSDRAFYQEINDRLVASDDDRRIDNALFINANGKDAIPVIMEPLRKLGIPAAGIYDLDFIKDGGNPSSRRLSAAQIPELMHSGLNSARSLIKATLEQSHANYKREGGVSKISGGDRVAVDSYIKQLGQFGIFLVPKGEVEGWLKDLKISGHAANWLIPVFEAMGNIGSKSYIEPTAGDVWDFIG